MACIFPVLNHAEIANSIAWANQSSDSHIRYIIKSLSIASLTKSKVHRSSVSFDTSSIWTGVRVTNECLPKILSEVSKLLGTEYGNRILPNLRYEDHRRKTQCLKYQTSTARTGLEALVGPGCWIHLFAPTYLLGLPLQRHRQSASNSPRSNTAELQCFAALRCHLLGRILASFP